LRTWAQVWGAGFEMPDSASRALFDMEAKLGLEGLPRRFYLGFLRGEPVATSLLFLGAGVAGIYGVTTLPPARRQGIGTITTLAPLREARAMGYRVGILFSSAMGAGVYRRLGFQEYFKHGHYIWTGESERDTP
jgi:GNAT superfamily N-acetyltransferase